MVNYPNVPSDFSLFIKLFSLTQEDTFCFVLFFFRTQLNENVVGSYLSILLWYIKMNYVICDTGLILAESVKLHGIVRARKLTIIFAISPEFWVLYFYPFKACVTDR